MKENLNFLFSATKHTYKFKRTQRISKYYFDYSSKCDVNVGKTNKYIKITKLQSPCVPCFILLREV